MGFSRYSYNMFFLVVPLLHSKTKKPEHQDRSCSPQVFYHRHGQIMFPGSQRRCRRQSRAPKTTPLESLESIDIYWILRELDPKYTLWLFNIAMGNDP